MTRPDENGKLVDEQSDEVAALLKKEQRIQSVVSIGMPAAIFSPSFLLMRLAWSGAVPWSLISVLAFAIAGACVALMYRWQWATTSRMLAVCRPGDGRVVMRLFQQRGMPYFRSRARREFRRLILEWPADSWSVHGEPATKALSAQLTQVAQPARPTEEDVRLARAIVDALREIATPAACQSLWDFSRSRPLSSEMEAVRQYAEQFVLEGEGLAEREDGAAVTSAAVRVDALPVASSPSDDLSHLLDRYGKFHSRLRVGVPIGAAATTIAVLAAILFMPAYSVLGFPVIQLEIVAAILLPLGLPLVGRLTDGQWQMVNELLRKCEPGDERVLLSVAQCMGFPGLRGRARDAIRDLIVRWPAASWRRAGEPSVAILTKQLSLMLRSRNLRTGDGEQARAILLALAEIATSSAHQALLDLSRSGSEGMDAELRGLAAELLPGVERRMGLRKQAGQLLHPVEKADDTLLRPHLGNVQSDPELLLRAGDE